MISSILLIDNLSTIDQSNYKSNHLNNYIPKKKDSQRLKFNLTQKVKSNQYSNNINSSLPVIHHIEEKHKSNACFAIDLVN